MMKCLFNVKTLRIDRNGKFIIELTEDERNFVEKTQRQFQNVRIADDFREDFEEIVPVVALTEYAYSLVRNFLKTGDGGDIERAIAAISKAFLIHPLPIYLYDLGRFFEYSGDYKAADQSYKDYLETEKKYKPVPVDEMLIKNHDISFVMEDAKKRIELLERGEK